MLEKPFEPGQHQDTTGDPGRRFEQLFDRAPLGYQSLDAEGRLIEVNQAWLELMGYNREEVIGRWFGDFLALYVAKPFNRKQLEEAVNSILHTA